VTHDAPFDTEKMWPDHGYLPHYLRIAADLGMHARVCELGVRRGDSLRLWQVLFPHGDVAGVDINPDATWPKGTTRIESAQDHPDLPELVGARDLIVDDASHDGQLTARSFELLWPQVTRGGYYVIEDWWFSWGMKGSMLAVAQNLLPLLGQPGQLVADIRYTWGLIIIRKQEARLMNLRDVLHQLIDCGSARWPDEDGQRAADAHEAVERYFLHPVPDGYPWLVRPETPPEQDARGVTSG
jgi:hypothetical protein